MFDVVIIGAGPAGLSAANICREYQLKVVVVDEFIKPGGRLLGQLHQEPDGTWWNGIEEAKKLTSRAEQLGVDICCGVSVHDINNQDGIWSIHTNQETFKAANLLLATGAAETPVPIPGWTLPGVMSIGAAQVMANVHRVRVGKKGVVVGINVLSAAITRELQLAGIDIACMALPAVNHITKDAGHPEKVMESLLRISHLAPSAFIRMGSKLVKSSWMQGLALKFLPKKGIKMWDMPIHLKKCVTQINGKNQVESVTICDVRPDGTIIEESAQQMEVDFVCIAGGLYPLAELAAIAGCPFQFIPELGGHVPVHNEKMETMLDGLYVAGNITGIESAKVAIAQGNVAGFSIVNRAFPNNKETIEHLRDAILNVHTTRNNASIQFHPGITDGRERLEKVYQEIS